MDAWHDRRKVSTPSQLLLHRFSSGEWKEKGGGFLTEGFQSAPGPAVPRGWLALLLIRIAENIPADTWRNVRQELQRIHLGEFSGSVGRLLQCTQLSATHDKLLHDLKVKVPPRFFELHPVASHSLDEA